jgi:hypothetical protein
MYQRFVAQHAAFSAELKQGATWLEAAVQYRGTSANYWDFESLLSALSSALDILARLAGLAYAEQTPLSFSKLCRRGGSFGPVLVLHRAQTSWVRRMKDYRDCFVHYTPVDSMLSIRATEYTNGLEVGGRLPVNPNAREPVYFRYRRRPELLRYTMSLLRQMTALDRALGREILHLYAEGKFPRRKDDLHGVGRRVRE